jgi:integrase
MRETMRKFEARFKESDVAELTAQSIKGWLSELPLAIKTRNRHLSYIKTALILGKKELGLVQTNPLEGVDPFSNSRLGQAKVNTFNPIETGTFLKAVRTEFLPFFGICFFTGLRRAEVELLDWSEIKLERKLIDLPPNKSKNRNRKLIEVPDNLYKILKPFERTEGAVIPSAPGLQIVMEETTEKAGLMWKQNVIRHSFCSHAVALKGLSWTATQADHSESVLKRDYLEAVTKDDAEKFFAIAL